MDKMLQLLTAFFVRAGSSKDDRGATATEYAMLIAFVAIVIVAGITVFGTALSNFFSALGTDLSGFFGG